MIKDTNLGSLPNDTKFEIILLKEMYRNLVLVRSNDCGALIRGDYTVDGQWRPIPVNYTIANSTKVRVKI
jgi:hypothetical protein